MMQGARGSVRVEGKHREITAQAGKKPLNQDSIECVSLHAPCTRSAAVHCAPGSKTWRQTATHARRLLRLVAKQLLHLPGQPLTTCHVRSQLAHEQWCPEEASPRWQGQRLLCLTP